MDEETRALNEEWARRMAALAPPLTPEQIAAVRQAFAEVTGFPDTELANSDDRE